MKTFSIIERKRTREILLSNGFKKVPHIHNRYAKKISKSKLIVDICVDYVTMRADDIMLYSKIYTEESFDFKSDLDAICKKLK